VKPGDRVGTARGPGTVTGFEHRTGWIFGHPQLNVFVTVRLDLTGKPLKVYSEHVWPLGQLRPPP
jgi:hypothetical protein